MTFNNHLIELRENLIFVIQASEFEKESRPMREAYNTALERLIMLETALERLKAELDNDPEVIEHRKNAATN